MFSYINSLFKSEEPFLRDIKTAISTVIDTKILPVNEFLDKIYINHVIISGSIILQALGLFTIVNTLDLYVTISNADSIVNYIISKGYKLFYIDSIIIFSNTIVSNTYDPHHRINKICNCTKSDNCIKTTCYKGTIRLFICNGSIIDYINNNANISYDLLMFNGRKYIGDSTIINITKNKLVTCKPTYKKIVTNQGFEVLNELFETSSYSYSSLCDPLITQSELTALEQYIYDEDLGFFIPIQ